MKGFARYVQRGYHNAKEIAGSVDHGISVAKRTLSALTPYLDQLGVSQAPAMRALQNYDEIKSRAMHAHSQGEQAYQSVRSRVPELALNFT